MEEVQIIHHGIFETPDYVVHVGIIPGDKLPLYLVFHKEYEVLEFTHNMIYFTKEAVAEMQSKLDEQNQADDGFITLKEAVPSGKAN